MLEVIPAEVAYGLEDIGQFVRRLQSCIPMPPPPAVLFSMTG